MRPRRAAGAPGPHQPEQEPEARPRTQPGHIPADASSAPHHQRRGRVWVCVCVCVFCKVWQPRQRIVKTELQMRDFLPWQAPTHIVAVRGAETRGARETRPRRCPPSGLPVCPPPLLSPSRLQHPVLPGRPPAGGLLPTGFRWAHAGCSGSRQGSGSGSCCT